MQNKVSVPAKSVKLYLWDMECYNNAENPQLRSSWPVSMLLLYSGVVCEKYYT